MGQYRRIIIGGGRRSGSGGLRGRFRAVFGLFDLSLSAVCGTRRRGYCSLSTVPLCRRRAVYRRLGGCEVIGFILPVGRRTVRRYFDNRLSDVQRC